ncbi:hypothetical protein QOT17_006061 [Balamuthia mandrillaris]
MKRSKEDEGGRKRSQYALLSWGAGASGFLPLLLFFLLSCLLSVSGVRALRPSSSPSSSATSTPLSDLNSPSSIQVPTLPDNLSLHDQQQSSSSSSSSSAEEDSPSEILVLALNIGIPLLFWIGVGVCGVLSILRYRNIVRSAPRTERLWTSEL